MVDGRILFVLGCLFFVGFAGAVIPDDCDINEKMIAYWRMNNNLDDSFDGYDAGSWIGTARYTSAVGLGAQFMGAESVSIPNVNELNFQFAWTVEFLINSNSFSNGILFKKGEYKIEWIDGGGGTSSVRASAGAVSVSSPSFLSNGIDYHIALVWEPVSSNLTLYVSSASSSYSNSASLSSPASSIGSLIIGEGFSGWIDEVAVYSSALDSDRVAYHFALLRVGKDYCDPSGVGGSSSTKSDFSIAGCGDVGLAGGTCSDNKEYYCSEDNELFVTRNDMYGCSLGAFSYNKGDKSCCPAGFYCNETALICYQSTEQCSEQESREDCENIGKCVWLNEEEVCIYTGDYGCSIYGTETTCDEDIWNLANEGVGVEICDVYSVVDGVGYSTGGSCFCDWDSEDLKCKLRYTISPDIYGNGTVDRFDCLKAFDMGPCIDGYQDFNWTVSKTEASGIFNISSSIFDINAYNKTAHALKCFDGHSVRNCGEPVIRLPGFSFFALIVSVLLIGVFYFWRR